MRDRETDTFSADSLALDGLRRPMTVEGSEVLERLAPALHVLKRQSVECDSAAKFPEATFDLLRREGVLSATVPARFGGGGVTSLHDVALLLARLAEVDAGAALAAHMQFSRGLTLTFEVEHGQERTRPLAGSLLRGMGDGDLVIASATKDVGIPTRLTSTPDGLRLTGRKILVSSATIATSFVVQTTGAFEGRERDLAVLVGARDVGVGVRDEWDGIGMRTSGTCSLELVDVHVNPEHVFDRGPVDESSDVGLAGQTISSIAMLGINVGLAQKARDLVVSHFQGREIPAAVSASLASMESRLFGVRAAVLLALLNADSLSHDFTGDLEARGRSMMTLFQQAKALVNSDGMALVEEAMRLIGGSTYTASHPLWRISRDMRANMFAHPYNYINQVDYLSEQALR